MYASVWRLDHLSHCLSITTTTTQDKGLKVWAVSLKTRLTNCALYHRVCSVASHPSSAMSYIYSGPLRHPAVRFWRQDALAELLRQHGMAFDPASRTGCIVHVPGSPACGTVGVLCIADSPPATAAIFVSVVRLLAAHAGDRSLATRESDLQCVLDLFCGRITALGRPGCLT